jgi:hypothetical protein
MLTVRVPRAEVAMADTGIANKRNVRTGNSGIFKRNFHESLELSTVVIASAR